MPDVDDYGIGLDMLSDYRAAGLYGTSVGDAPIGHRDDEPQKLVITGGEGVHYKVDIPVPSVETAPWFMEAVHEVLGFTQLPADWDSYGGRAPSLRVAATAGHILGMVARQGAPRPNLVPTSAGGVQLEWHREGVDLEIEVVSSVRVRLWCENLATGQTEEKELFSDFSPILRVVSNLIR